MSSSWERLFVYADSNGFGRVTKQMLHFVCLERRNVCMHPPLLFLSRLLSLSLSRPSYYRDNRSTNTFLPLLKAHGLDHYIFLSLFWMRSSFTLRSIHTHTCLPFWSHRAPQDTLKHSSTMILLLALSSRLVFFSLSRQCLASFFFSSLSLNFSHSHCNKERNDFTWVSEWVSERERASK